MNQEPLTPEQLAAAQAEYDAFVRDLNPEFYVDPKIEDLCKRMSAFAKQHDIIIITTPRIKDSEVALLFEKDGKMTKYSDFFELREDRGDLQWGFVGMGQIPKPGELLTIRSLKPRPKLPRDDAGNYHISLEMTDRFTSVFGGQQMGRTAACQEARRGGFADVQMETDMRPRSERRGHKPKKILKGQDYLNLRKGY